MNSRNRFNATCLNVGCGLSSGREWLNVDSSYSLRLSRLPIVGRILSKVLSLPGWPRAVVAGDVVKGLDISVNRCDLVFASHVLEHLAEEDCYRALRNIYLYLRPGGYFRCIVPDLETHARSYLARLESLDPAASHSFMTDANVGLRSSRSGARARLGEAFSNTRHQWMWDRVSLASALREVGFRDVAERGYGEWADARFAQVEERERHQGSVCLEARKPCV